MLPSSTSHLLFISPHHSVAIFRIPLIVYFSSSQCCHLPHPTYCLFLLITALPFFRILLIVHFSSSLLLFIFAHHSVAVLPHPSNCLSSLITALPFFRIPLEHQHLDVGQDLTWRCQADGVPSITYSWYKDTKQLTQDTLLEADKDRISVQTNVLTIKNVDPVKDSGMYQCGATNIHGQRFSSAQLRVMGTARFLHLFVYQFHPSITIILNNHKDGGAILPFLLINDQYRDLVN